MQWCSLHTTSFTPALAGECEGDCKCCSLLLTKANIGHCFSFKAKFSINTTPACVYGQVPWYVKRVSLCVINASPSVTTKEVKVCNVWIRQLFSSRCPLHSTSTRTVQVRVSSSLFTGLLILLTRHLSVSLSYSFSIYLFHTLSPCFLIVHKHTHIYSEFQFQKKTPTMLNHEREKKEAVPTIWSEHTHTLRKRERGGRCLMLTLTLSRFQQFSIGWLSYISHRGPIICEFLFAHILQIVKSTFFLTPLRYFLYIVQYTVYFTLQPVSVSCVISCVLRILQIPLQPPFSNLKSECLIIPSSLLGRCINFSRCG